MLAALDAFATGCTDEVVRNAFKAQSEPLYSFGKRSFEHMITSNVTADVRQCN